MNKILQGDCLELLKTLPDGLIDCIVTSPPYYGLRDYGTAKWEGGDVECDHKQTTARHDGGRVNTNGFHGSAATDSDKGAINFRDTCGKCGAIRVDSQIGLEATPEEYVAKMVEVFRECKRVLKKEGTLWLNLGDSYANTGCDSSSVGGFTGERIRKKLAGLNPNDSVQDSRPRKIPINLKPKDLIGIPWRVALALQADGWYLRQDIIWHKPNPMPESVTDRCTKAHEYIFLLSKSAHYYFDNEAIKEETQRNWANVGGNLVGYGIHKQGGEFKDIGDRTSTEERFGRNKRSVWTVNTKPYSEAHFATFPEKLIEPCILAGCPKDGIVMDIFMGAGTTAVVAIKNKRNYLGIELNSEYIEICNKRILEAEETMKQFNLFE